MNFRSVHIPLVVHEGLPDGMRVTSIFFTKTWIPTFLVYISGFVSKHKNFPVVLYHNIYDYSYCITTFMTFDVLFANLCHASTNWWNVNKNIIKFSYDLSLLF